MLVVDDYTRYTTVFPLCSKGEVVDVLIPWIRAVRLLLRERFRQALRVLRLHFVRGGEFSSDLLRTFCRGEGILQSFTLLDSPQQNGIAERRIGLVMEVARTSTIHAGAPHFLWPFAVCPTVTAVPTTAATATATAATAAPMYYTAMASLRVLAFDRKGRPVQFDTWLDDLQRYLLSGSKDSVSLFDIASGVATAPPTTADSSTHSQWLTRDAAARLAIRNHLPLAECAHFGQHRTAQALYDAVVARYSSPATAALGRLLLPYLFPELSSFATVEDRVSHLRASDARYRATVPADFLDRNPPPMDHFLSLDPTSLTVDLLEQHLLAAETSAVAVGAARGTPRSPFLEGCPPSPLAPSYASAAAADVSVPEDIGAASASAKCRSSKGKGGRGSGGGSGGSGGGSGSGGGGSGSGGEGSNGGGGGGGSGGGSGGSGGGGGGSGGSGGSGGGGTSGGGTDARRVGSGGGQRQQQQRRSETLSPQQLREWFLRGASGGSCPFA
ncbi:unnamed protein product [Closterium sp. NIES-53]